MVKVTKRGKGDRMLRLYVVRHGETVWNTEKKLQGWKDSKLTENGIKNAILLGNRLKNLDFQSIYTSPSGRTKETAKLISGDRKQIFIEDENLREINLGDWEGQTHDNIKEQYPSEYDAFWNKPHLYKSNSGEDFYQLNERVKQFLERVKSEQVSGNILIVTHTVFIKTLLAHCKSLSIEQLWGPPFIHDTSLSIIDMNDGEFKIIVEADISHKNMESAK